MATCTSQQDGPWSAAATWDIVPADGDAVVINHHVLFDADMSGWASGVTLFFGDGAHLYTAPAAATSFLKGFVDAVALLRVDANPMYPGFGPPGRAGSYWQFIPPPGAGGYDEFPAGDIFDISIQINRTVDDRCQGDALDAAEALHNLLHNNETLAVTGYTVHEITCLQRPFLRTGLDTGQVFVTFNLVATVQRA